MCRVVGFCLLLSILLLFPMWGYSFSGLLGGDLMCFIGVGGVALGYGRGIGSYCLGRKST